jgi:hypothetical protein
MLRTRLDGYTRQLQGEAASLEKYRAEAEQLKLELLKQTRESEYKEA